MDANSMRKIFILGTQGGGQTRERTFNDREISDYLTLAQEKFTTSRFTPDANVKQKGFGADSKRNIDLSGLITSRVQYTVDDDDFMVGTPANGALRKPNADLQYDFSSNAYGNSQYGVFCEVPDEAIFVISGYADCAKNPATALTTYNSVPVSLMSYDYYNSWATDPYHQPYHSEIWAMEYGAYTVAGQGNGQSVKGMTGVSTRDGLTAVTIDTNRAHMLLAGNDFDILRYELHYVKMPKAIRVDILNPANQVNCELPIHTHREIVDIAIEMAVKSVIPMEQRYNIADKAVKENE